jgi:hypothetical protein
MHKAEKIREGGRRDGGKEKLSRNKLGGEMEMDGCVKQWSVGRA